MECIHQFSHVLFNGHLQGCRTQGPVWVPKALRIGWFSLFWIQGQTMPLLPWAPSTCSWLLCRCIWSEANHCFTTIVYGFSFSGWTPTVWPSHTAHCRHGGNVLLDSNDCHLNACGKGLPIMAHYHYSNSKLQSIEWFSFMSIIFVLLFVISFATGPGKALHYSFLFP